MQHSFTVVPSLETVKIGHWMRWSIFRFWKLFEREREVSITWLLIQDLLMQVLTVSSRLNWSPPPCLGTCSTPNPYISWSTLLKALCPSLTLVLRKASLTFMFRSMLHHIYSAIEVLRSIETDYLHSHMFTILSLESFKIPVALWNSTRIRTNKTE